MSVKFICSIQWLCPDPPVNSGFVQKWYILIWMHETHTWFLRVTLSANSSVNNPCSIFTATNSQQTLATHKGSKFAAAGGKTWNWTCIIQWSASHGFLLSSHIDNTCAFYSTCLLLSNCHIPVTCNILLMVTSLSSVKCLPRALRLKS